MYAVRGRLGALGSLPGPFPTKRLSFVNRALSRAAASRKGCFSSADAEAQSFEAARENAVPVFSPVADSWILARLAAHQRVYAVAAGLTFLCGATGAGVFLPLRAEEFWTTARVRAGVFVLPPKGVTGEGFPDPRTRACWIHRCFSAWSTSPHIRPATCPKPIPGVVCVSIVSRFASHHRAYGVARTGGTTGVMGVIAALPPAGAAAPFPAPDWFRDAPGAALSAAAAAAAAPFPGWHRVEQIIAASIHGCFAAGDISAHRASMTLLISPVPSPASACDWHHRL
mmetsp:Transcript_53124/g.121336  ORF Transcript_53124/g.121336 Transcript_53124/m.121336 type:complete len:284 (-) Transcript_53124:60-911(-)